MLALMPQSPALPFNAAAPLIPGTLSVAILPSAPLARGQHSVSALPINRAPTSTKRPKLSLNTVTVPSVFGKGSTSLRLDTLSTTSPTSRNTFQNAYSPQAQQLSTPSRLTSSPQSLDESDGDDDDDDQTSSSQTDDSDYNDRDSSSTSSSSSSATSVSTVDSYPDEAPYQLSSSTRSILSNGPIPRVRYRKAARKMFPPRKAVSFRTPLTEDVRTCKYTWSNNDLEALSSPIVISKPLSSAQCTLEPPQHALEAVHDNDDPNDTSALCPATPVAGKRKRDRQWVWTLGSSTSESDDADSAAVDA